MNTEKNKVEIGEDVSKGFFETLSEVEKQYQDYLKSVTLANLSVREDDEEMPVYSMENPLSIILY